MVKTIGVIAGVIGVVLGGLWLLQGLGVVSLRPILCFADCDPIQGPSMTWVILGFLVTTGGICLVLFSARRRFQRIAR
jgi:hypothetical protein